MTTGIWIPTEQNVAVTAGSTAVISGRTSVPATATATSESDAAPAPKLALTPDVSNQIIPGSVMFSAAGKQYYDRDGTVYSDFDPTTGQGIAVGAINYVTGEVTFSDWANNTEVNIGVISCLTGYGEFTATYVAFRTSGAPIRPGSLFLQVDAADGNQLTATADANGALVGAHLRGHVSARTGVVFVEFGDMVAAAGQESQPWYRAQDVVSGQIFKPSKVYPGTLRYNAVVQTSLPLDANIIGIDPVRLPSDGRVPIFRPGNVVVLHHTLTTTPATVSNSQVVHCGRVRLARVKVLGADGLTITSGYTVDLDAGDVTFTNVAGYSQPVRIEHRIEDMMLLSDAQISGDLTATRAATHDYPIGAYASSAMILGDMKARVPVFFDQATWVNSAWADSINGAAATGTYNDVLAPLLVTNKGAITERWVVRFTSTTGFEVIGEHVGVIATGSTNADCAPLNPAAGVPYFTILETGWGTGWAAGNILRFNTQGALYPIWIARTIQQGPATALDDSFTVLIRGDVDRP